MRSVNFKPIVLTVLAVLPCLHGGAQTMIDGVIAVVSGEPILYSEMEVRMEQARRGGETSDRTTECDLLENILFEKLLIEQARIDSVEVDEAQVEAELNRRIQYYVHQLGSEEKLEEFYGRPIGSIKAEFRDDVEDQMLIEMMQDKLVGSVRVTPRDVEKLFATITPDSLPRINAQVEFGMIVKAPKPTSEEVSRVKRKLDDFRKGVLDGTKDFCVLAELYSEDPGSKENCGELGMVSPGTMVAAFDAVALSLREGEVSQVFETEYGYHIMRMIARRGQQYNAQHILLRPQTSSAGQAQARALLDSLATQVRLGKADFSKLAAQLSDDDDSRAMGGVVVDPSSNSARWSMGDLEQQDFFVLDKLKVGEVSDPLPYTLPDGTRAWRILRLAVRTEPHVANLKEDYPLFQRFTEGRTKQDIMSDWVKERVADTYVRINEEYKTCPFEHPWVVRP